MNKTRYSATEFGGNKPMNFRPSGTLTAELDKNSKFLRLCTPCNQRRPADEVLMFACTRQWANDSPQQCFISV